MTRRYLVGVDGGVWSLSPVEFERFLEQGARGEGFDLTRVGRRLADAAWALSPRAPVPRPLSRRAVRPLLWDPEEFADRLSALRCHGKDRKTHETRKDSCVR